MLSLSIAADADRMENINVPEGVLVSKGSVIDRSPIPLDSKAWRAI
jgi:hypothetical protein